MQNFGLCSALRAFGPHLLLKIFSVSSVGLTYLVTSYDTQADAEDVNNRNQMGFHNLAGGHRFCGDFAPLSSAMNHKQQKPSIFDLLLFYVPLKNFSHIWPNVTIDGEGLQNLGLCSVLRAFGQGGIFIVPHLL
jgi:hypothetical protein